MPEPTAGAKTDTRSSFGEERGTLTQQAAEQRRKRASFGERGGAAFAGGRICECVVLEEKKGRVLLVCVSVCLCLCAGMVCCVMHVNLSAHSHRGVHLCNGVGVGVGAGEMCVVCGPSHQIVLFEIEL